MAIPQARKKILNVTIYCKIANKTYKEVTPHSGQNGHH